MNEGIEERKQLEAAGFGPEDIQAWESETRTNLAAAGFGEKETNEYFGIHDPDMAAVKSVVQTNMAIKKTLPKKANPEGMPDDPHKGFLEEVTNAFGMGWDNSVTGLMINGKLPETVLPEDAPRMARIASQVGQIAGDVPAMIVGALGGGAAGGAAGVGLGATVGSAVPVAGTIAGAAALGAGGAFLGAGGGANALPAAMRQALTDHYTKGDIKDFGDFWDRSSAAFLSALKEGSLGAAATAVGGKVGLSLAGTAAPAAAKVLLPAASEVATLVTLGKGLEGQVPTADDFIDGAFLIAGMHGSIAVAGKLRNIYAKTGLKPADVAEMTNADPTIQQELLADNVDMPKGLQNFVEQTPPPKGLDNVEPVNFEASIDSLTKDMMAELKEADRTQQLIRDEQGNVINRVDDNSYPEWYGDVKSGNLEKTMADLSNPNSAAYKRLRAKAEQTLLEGRVKRTGEKILPDEMYRYSKGLDPATDSVKSGEVIHFDGSDGVIRMPDGETIHFDASTVKENFKVGDEVRFQPKMDGEFPTAEVVFGTKTKEMKAMELPKSDDIQVSDAGEIVVKTAEGGTRPPTAQEKILAQVGERGPRSKAKLNWDNFYTNFVDKYNPIKIAAKELSGGEKLDTTSNPYELSRMANDYKAKVKHVFERGMIDYKTLKVVGKSFKEIIKPFEKDITKIDGLKAYMIAERALEIEGRGITSGFDLQAAKEVVAAGKKEFGQAAKELVEFQNSALQYAKDAGLISDKAFASMKEAGKSYVSFTRILDESDAPRGQGKSKPLKNLKGSERKIQDPFVSMIENTEALFKAAEVNRATETLVKLAEASEGQTVIEKVKTKMKPIKITDAEAAKGFESSQLFRELEDFGFEKGDIDIEGFNIFRPMEKRNLAPNEFEVMRNGKREVYKTSPELAEALNRLDGDATAKSLAFKLANGITTIKKIGITFTPDFILKNVFRDQLTAGVFSEGGSIPFKDIFGAMGDIMKKNDTYYNWLKSGGAGGAFLELDSSYLSNDLLQLSTETGFKDKVFNQVKKPVEMLKLLGTLTEEGTRLAEFKRVTKGATEGDVMFKGGMASREITVDFQRVGAKMSAMNAITAFTNVGIQGLDRTVRAVKSDPMGVVTKGLTYLTMPSILLWYANKDDQRVKEIPRWQKDLFWIIATDDWQPAKDAAELEGMPKHLYRQNEDGSYSVNKGNIYRLPKPQELGMIFGTMPERMLEAFFTDNPRALEDFSESIGSLIAPNFIPDAALPLVEQGVNKNLFTSAPLVSPQMEGRLSELQYTEYTSETAKTLGKLIGQIPVVRDIGADETKLSSPAVIENYIKSWTGALGTYAVQVADKALEKAGIVKEVEKPAWTVADLPIIKAFAIRHPSASAQSIQDFFERNEKAEKVFESINFLKKSGDMEGINKIIKNPEYEAIMFKSTGVKQALGQMAAAVRAIHVNPEMNKDEKRQQIDTIYFQMQEVARYGNQAMDEWENSVKNKRQ